LAPSMKREFVMFAEIRMSQRGFHKPFHFLCERVKFGIFFVCLF
jgi:hypothetical protein